jgi:hypothetical protein
MIGYPKPTIDLILDEFDEGNMCLDTLKAKLLLLFGVSRRSEQLVCDACKKYKQTNTLEDCKCGKGQMWVRQTNCC